MQDVARDIVVIGASAGGVEAMARVVEGLPRDLPAVVCVAIHLNPAHRSRLPAVLSRAGGPPALHPVDRQPVERGRIYVAPPDHHMMMDDGQLRLWKGPKENLHRPAVNALFRSAAVLYRTRVIGIVLSGSMDDGATGLWWIKRYGGLAIVQDPDDAKFPAMPLSAMSTVDVDYRVTVADLPALLVRLVSGRTDEVSAPLQLER